MRHGRRRAADHHPHPAGLRDRAGQAAARRGHRLLADARLRLADRPRRVPDGRRDRAVDDLPDAGHAELPAGGHAPHARALPPARARPAAALVGGPVRPQPRLQPDPRQDRGRQLPRQRRLGHLRLQGRARSSARPWPSSSTPAARPTSSPPSRSSASTRTGSCPSSPPPPSATNRPWSHREEQPRDRPGSRAPADRVDRRADRARRRRVRALRPLQGEDRRWRRSTACSDAARRQARLRGGDDADQGRRGQDDHRGRPDAGPRASSASARCSCLREPSLGPVFGIKGGAAGGGTDPGRPDGGPQPALHRRHPRHRRGQQPAGGDARRLDPARKPACDRRAAGRVAPRGGHERPRPAPDRPSASAAAPTAIRARPASTSPPPPRSWPSSRCRAICRTCAAAWVRSPSATATTGPSRSPPRTSRPPARWPSCSRTRSSPT